MSQDEIEFDGEYLNGSEWNGKIKEQGTNYIKEGEYKNGKFSGKVKRKNIKGEFYETIYLNGIVWTGFKIDKDDFLESQNKVYNEYLNGRIWKGKGIELYPDNKKLFEGEYDKGKKIKGKEYYEDGKLKFEGEYINGQYYNGKGYSVSGEVYEIKEGKNIPEDFSKYGIKYEGEYLNGEKNGKGKEYYKQKLIFEGEFLEGKRNGKGKNIMIMVILNLKENI